MTHLGSNINVAEFISSSPLTQIAAGEKEKKHFMGQKGEVGTIYSLALALEVPRVRGPY
jgi:hypothetical protein